MKSQALYDKAMEITGVAASANMLHSSVFLSCSGSILDHYCRSHSAVEIWWIQMAELVFKIVEV